MKLLPRELDKLIINQVGSLAQKRLARGVKLNYVETVALISAQLLEFIRDGKHTVAELMDIGTRILGRRHVMPEVCHCVHEIQVEGTFKDGTKLITIHDPISSDDGDLELALYGSFLPAPSKDKFPLAELNEYHGEDRGPGCVLTAKADPIVLVSERKRISLKVTNTGDRPIQVGSHYHFMETNKALEFDRSLSYGKKLDIPAGSAVRFEPGETKTVSLADFGGNMIMSGGNGYSKGKFDTSRTEQIVSDMVKAGFLHKKEAQHEIHDIAPFKLPRELYAQSYGPTTGDRVRLGDTCLWLEVEKDMCKYGDEAVFGGGKVLREGMGQSNYCLSSDSPDLVITNALIVDYSGIYKADVGIKNGLICGIGKSGNPDVMDGVDPSLVFGASTEVLAGEGKILTAGGIDTHVHFICPQLATEAISSGLTTLVGGGTGPNTGTNATTCTAGPKNIEFMLQAVDGLPLNFGFTGKGNCSSPEALREQIHAGAVGLKLHEDYGTTPAAIDNCLSVCDEEDVQVTIHTDTLNESGFVEDTISAFKNRTIHAYHTEGAGGGHAPDIIRVCSLPNVIPSSTNPTRPFTVNTLDEHLDMLMVCHHLDKNIPEDIAFAESRIRAETIGAEDVLHDIGAISVISSDSQAMGRIGEVICRTWQTADKMKQRRGVLSSESKADNARIKRYIAKYTINPAIAHGLSHIVGSVEVGKLADMVLWDPAFFGSKPEVVLKGGVIAWANMGDANASIPTPQPVLGRSMFGGFPSAIQNESSNVAVTFVSKHAAQQDLKKLYGLKKKVVAVQNCRNVGKKDMKLNDYMPDLKVDPETYEVTIDGTVVKMAPATLLPLAQLHNLF